MLKIVVAKKNSFGVIICMSLCLIFTVPAIKEEELALAILLSVVEVSFKAVAG